MHWIRENDVIQWLAAWRFVVVLFFGLTENNIIQSLAVWLFYSQHFHRNSAQLLVTNSTQRCLLGNHAVMPSVCLQSSWFIWWPVIQGIGKMDRFTMLDVFSVVTPKMFSVARIFAFFFTSGQYFTEWGSRCPVEHWPPNLATLAQYDPGKTDLAAAMVRIGHFRKQSYRPTSQGMPVKDIFFISDWRLTCINQVRVSI